MLNSYGPAGCEPALFPHLIQAIEAGIVEWDGREYYGTASDGTEVNLGSEPETTNMYLAYHPTRETW